MNEECDQRLKSLEAQVETLRSRFAGPYSKFVARIEHMENEVQRQLAEFVNAHDTIVVERLRDIGARLDAEERSGSKQGDRLSTLERKHEELCLSFLSDERVNDLDALLKVITGNNDFRFRVIEKCLNELDTRLEALEKATPVASMNPEPETEFVDFATAMKALQDGKNPKRSFGLGWRNFRIGTRVIDSDISATDWMIK